MTHLEALDGSIHLSSGACRKIIVANTFFPKIPKSNPLDGLIFTKYGGDHGEL